MYNGKISVDYKKLYYGFPVILISFYDKDGNPNVTTLSSSYTLTDMVAVVMVPMVVIHHADKEMHQKNISSIIRMTAICNGFLLLYTQSKIIKYF